MTKPNASSLFWVLLSILPTVLFYGCGERNTQSVESASSMIRNGGKVDPRPDGCLYMEFFSPANDSACKREAGRISAVITPTKRVEPLKKQWRVAEFEKTIVKTDWQTDRLGHYLPGPAAWKYVKKTLQPGDEIWTFGLLDTGFVILREGNLFCLVITEHKL